MLVDTKGLTNGSASVESGSGEDAGGSGEDAGGSGGDAGDASTSVSEGEAPAGSTYREAVMADKPLAYYRLDEKALGDVVKDETGRFDGVHSGSIEVGAPPLLGGSEAAVSFSGAGDIWIKGGLDFQGTAPFTVELWLSKRAVYDKHHFPFFKEEGTGTSRRGYGIYVIDDTVKGERFVAGNYAGVAATGIGAGRVVHIVMTYSGKTLALYVDGALVATTSDARPARASTERSTRWPSTTRPCRRSGSRRTSPRALGEPRG
jgi:hypothetical protein